MNRSAVIFDLDDTLVDTRAIRHLRDRRQWKAAVGELHRTSLFPGVEDLLRTLNERDIPWGIVTTSVSFYAAAALRHHGFGAPALIAYHDAPPKPHPKCIEQILARLGATAAEAVAIGDHQNDHAAYSAAGVLSLGAGWSPVLQRAQWDAVLPTPAAILTYL